MKSKAHWYLMGLGFLIILFSREGFDAVWTVLGLTVAMCGLGSLVFSHELGHFLGGCLTNMAMPSFQVGFGTPIYSRRIGETEWKLCPIPLGGAVRFVGEDAGETGDIQELAKEPGREGLLDEQRWFHNQPWWAQLLVLAFGPLFSILSAIPILFFAALFFGTVDLSTPPVVASVREELPAAKAGIQQDDLILSVDAQEVESIEELFRVLSSTGSGPLHIEYQRGTEVLQTELEPIDIGGEAFLGLEPKHQVRACSLSESGALALGGTLQQVQRQTSGIYALCTGQISPRMMTGPVGIIHASGRTAEQGPRRFFNFLALITVALGLTNLLPIPVLDGGRMVLVVLRRFVGKKVADIYEPVALAIGVVAVLLIILVVTIKDIYELI